MTAITSYLYNNKLVVQLSDDDDITITTRNRVVYQRPIEIYRGADNPITIYFKNQDQKPANITGNVSFTGYIINEYNSNVVANLSVTISNVTAAVASTVITSDIVNTLPQSKYKLAFMKNDGVYNTPTYSNDNYQVCVELNVNQAFATNYALSATTQFTGNASYGLGDI